MYDKEIIMRSMDVAAEKFGDITPMVYARLFSTHPETEQLFLLKGTPFKSSLQRKMVQDAIFSFLEYLETPEEVEIELRYTIPQHLDLGIGAEQFNALLTALADTVCEAMPPEESKEAKTSWNCLTTALSMIVSGYAAERA